MMIYLGLLKYGKGGGLQNGKIAGPKLFAPPPQDRVKVFTPPLLPLPDCRERAFLILKQYVGLLSATE